MKNKRSHKSSANLGVLESLPILTQLHIAHGMLNRAAMELSALFEHHPEKPYYSTESIATIDAALEIQKRAVSDLRVLARAVKPVELLSVRKPFPNEIEIRTASRK